MDHLKEWRESVINKDPVCRKCNEKYTPNYNESLLIVGFDYSIDKFYSEHKQCKPIIKTFTKIKEK